MAHHSGSQFNDDLLRRIFPDRPQLGATGEFPQGRLTPEDEGEIRLGITVLDGKVVIDFGKPVAWFGMDADQARGLGETLIRRAGEVG